MLQRNLIYKNSMLSVNTYTRHIISFTKAVFQIYKYAIQQKINTESHTHLQ